MGGSGMGALTKFDKHILIVECKGPKDITKAAQFTSELHALLKKHGATIKFDELRRSEERIRRLARRHEVRIDRLSIERVPEDT